MARQTKAPRAMGKHEGRKEAKRAQRHAEAATEIALAVCYLRKANEDLRQVARRLSKAESKMRHLSRRRGNASSPSERPRTIPN